MRSLRLLTMTVIVTMLSATVLIGQGRVMAQTTTCPNAPAPRLAVGRNAHVTAGIANNLREQPSKSAKLLTQIPGDSLMYVIGGPVCADGYTYWQVQYNDQTGWTPEGTGTRYFVEPLTSAVSIYQIAPTDKSVTVQYGKTTLTYTGAFGSRVEADKVFATKTNTDDPFWNAAPEYTEFRFGTAPDQNAYYRQANIGVYPLPDYVKVSDVVKTAATTLTATLKAQKRPPETGFTSIPPANAGQVFHAQLKFLTFDSGKGMRFLTMFAQDVSPVTNDRLVYVYQGLTDDGKYVITAQFPLRTDALADKFNDVKDFPDLTGSNAGDLFTAYMKKTTVTLDALNPGDYQPSLDDLDAIMQSIVIK